MILAATTGICIMSGIFVFGCLILIGVILLQKGREAGLSGAFGGGGGQSAFGAKTGDVLTWVTVGLGIFLLTLIVVLNRMFQPTTYDTSPAPTNPPMAIVTPAPASMPASQPEFMPETAPAAATLPAAPAATGAQTSSSVTSPPPGAAIPPGPTQSQPATQGAAP